MMRFASLIQLVLYICFLSFSLQSVQASPLPVLAAVSKYKPGSKKTVTVTKTKQKRNDVLGKRGDISAVKVNPSIAKSPTRIKSRRHYRWITNVRKKISAKSAIIIDADTGKTLFSKQADSPRQPASTIKVLTGMIALKSLEENDRIGVSRHAAGMPRSKVYLDTSKAYKADDLINAVLLASANDASVALAEKVAGSEKQFAEMMTLRARLWGAKNTVCRTATGLTTKGQKSTARDLARIFRHAMQDEEFSNRMGRTNVRTSYGEILRNHNKALWTVDGAEGGKTGYTRAARQTYVGQFSRGNDVIIVAIMGSEAMWVDIKNLVDYGFQRQRQAKVASNEAAGKG